MKIRDWNRADSALFDAVNVTFWQKINRYGIDRMQHDINDLHSRIDELMKFCVAGKTSFVPKWSEASIELGCQTKTRSFGVVELLTSMNKEYILTEEGKQSEKCRFLTMDEPTFTKILWENQTERFRNILSV